MLWLGWYWAFCGKVKLLLNALYGNALCIRLYRNYWSLRSGSCCIYMTNQVHEKVWILEVKVITWPFAFCPRSLRFSFKHLLKSLAAFSSSKPKGWWPWNSVSSIWYSSTTKFVKKMALVWPWPILRQGHIWSLMLLYGKIVKINDFSETIAVYDIKVGIWSPLNEYMTLYGYLRSRSSMTLVQVTQIQQFHTSFPQ